MTDLTHFRALLFDLDGVLTPTAEVHMRAWAELFNAYLAERGREADYTDRDYFVSLDGKPRYDGVQSFLASRGIELPWGDPSDGADAQTVCGLGNRKNVVFADVLEREGVAPYPGSVALLDWAAEAGLAVAVVSSSKNARPVLTAAGLIGRFPVIVDGLTAEEESLPGKPNPEMFLRAASLLKVEPTDAVVLEDALSGVAAGRAGGFGLVVGVDRGLSEGDLREAGADILVHDLAELVPASPEGAAQ